MESVIPTLESSTFGSRVRRAITLGLCALMLAACSVEPPEQRLRAQLASTQQALEAGKIDEVMDAVAEDFSGPQGMDRAALHKLLRVQLFAGRRIGATTGPLDVAISGQEATVRFDAMLTSRGQGAWLPQQANGYAVTMGWRDENGDWRLRYADWQAKR